MATPATVERFDIGRTIGRAGDAVRRNPGLFALLGLILQFIPSVLSQGTLPQPTPRLPGIVQAFSGVAAVAVVVDFTLYFVLQAAVTYATVADLAGETPSLGTALRRGFRLLLPIVGLAILIGVGVFAGLLLFLVPGIILAVMWSVAAPAMVEENLGVLASLSRSRALTKGSRWRIFLLGLAAVIAYALFNGLVLVIFGVTDSLGTGDSSGFRLSISGFGVGMVVLCLVNAALKVAVTALLAAVYVELRYVRDGERPESLAAVFA